MDSSLTLKPKCRRHYVTVALYIAPTNLQLVILSGASLEMKWGPAPDADQSLLTYTVTAEGVNVETKHVTTTPGDSSVTLSSLQELTVYNVSVQAVNSGGPSRSLTAAVRMVTAGQLGRTGVQHFLCFFIYRVCVFECEFYSLPLTSQYCIFFLYRELCVSHNVSVCNVQPKQTRAALQVFLLNGLMVSSLLY